ncbi:hypothetical protein KIPB_014500, partial [Kipferlia bialata]|eukprot:g14500.t1
MVKFTVGFLTLVYPSCKSGKLVSISHCKAAWVGTVNGFVGFHIVIMTGPDLSSLDADATQIVEELYPCPFDGNVECATCIA